MKVKFIKVRFNKIRFRKVSFNKVKFIKVKFIKVRFRKVRFRKVRFIKTSVRLSSDKDICIKTLNLMNKSGLLVLLVRFIKLDFETKTIVSSAQKNFCIGPSD